MLIYFLSLFNSIFFTHSHWYDGQLVALHAHPYNIDYERDGNKKRDTHSQEEYELYDLIYNTPLLELEFFYLAVNPFYGESSDIISYVFISFESKIKPLHSGRGPPITI
jgi:hypothetical protein